MALGSKDDMDNKARVVEGYPHKYSHGEESDLVMRSGEVYTWLLRIGDSVTHEPRVMRGGVGHRPVQNVLQHQETLKRRPSLSGTRFSFPFSARSLAVQRTRTRLATSCSLRRYLASLLSSQLWVLAI